MNENRNQRIQELFIGALELPAAEREEWLRSKCGDDQTMLDEVADLLRHDQATADPLERGLDRDVLSDVGLVQRADQSGLHVRCPHCHHPIELVDEAELSDVVCESCGSSFSLIAADETKSYSTAKPTKIAHFDLIERVGIGAFGSVFKARDTKLDRIVAVKVPRKGQLSGDEAEKFLREAQTAAQLKHPNIVAVHEVGREDDRVFIVSDFVDGVTLSDWLTGMQPTPRETAEHCITIARALQYAHEHGVIHRDMKPGNIMLDRNNQPFLMDFGLAKREAAEITMTMEGQVLGTPAYMSPEQARGDAHSVDGTTDIYAVGVILFEMLTGERPFRGNLRMLLHQVLTEEAPSPRKYNASIPRDLETICLKCLEKTPARRYATADDLSEDLQRFVDHKPIDARPITRIERGWRWCKRKPAIASLVALLFLALGIGTAVSSYFAVDASLKAQDLSGAVEKEKKLVFEKDALVKQKESLITDLQESNRRATLATQDAVTKKNEAENVLNFFREKILVAARPGNQDGGLGVDVTLRSALDRAEPLISETFDTQPLIEATIRHTLGRSYSYLGEYKAAIRQLELAVELRTVHLGEGHVQTLESMSALASNFSFNFQLAKAFELHQKTLELRKSLLGPKHPDTLTSMDELGKSLFDNGQYQEAFDLHTRTLVLREEVLGAENPKTLQSMTNLADAMQGLGQRRARKLLEQVMEIQTERLGPNHPDTLLSRKNWIETFWDAQERVVRFEGLLAIARRELGEDHLRSLDIMNGLAIAYRGIGRMNDSIKTFEDAYQISSQKLGNLHLMTFRISTNLGYSYYQNGEHDKAIRLLREKVCLWEEQSLPNHPVKNVMMGNLVRVFYKLGRFEDVHPLEIKISRYAAERERKFKGETPLLAYHLTTLAWSLLGVGEFDQAEQPCRESIDIYRSMDPEEPETWRLPYTEFLLGQVFAEQKNLAQAKPLMINSLERLLDIRDQIPRSATPDLTEEYLIEECLGYLVEFLSDHGSLQESKRWADLLTARRELKAITDIRNQNASATEIRDAISVLENAETVARQKPDLAALRDLLARSLQWNKALAANKLIPKDSENWQQLVLLYMAGKHDQYKTVRTKFLRGDFAKANASQCYHSLLAALLLPLNDTDHNSVRFLAERVFQGTKDWEKQMAASAMYRLGEFDEWMNKLPEDSPLKAKNKFQRACVNFQSDPSEQNRRALNQIVEREEKNAENQIKEGVLPQHWHNYVQRIGWIEEGKRLLSLDKENAKK